MLRKIVSIGNIVTKSTKLIVVGVANVTVIFRTGSIKSIWFNSKWIKLIIRLLLEMIIRLLLEMILTS